MAGIEQDRPMPGLEIIYQNWNEDQLTAFFNVLEVETPEDRRNLTTRWVIFSTNLLKEWCVVKTPSECETKVWKSLAHRNISDLHHV